MKRRRILVDCDGVLADLVASVCAVLAAHGYRRAPTDFKEHDFDHTLSAAELRIVDEWAAQPGAIAGLGWYPSARVFLECLKDHGDVVCITAPWHSPTWDHERRSWLAPHLRRMQVVSCPSTLKPYFSGDVLIEDRADTLANWLAEHPSGRGVLIARPWNASAPAHPRIHRTGNYYEALQAAVSP